MKFITVNPTWNVPPSIIQNEYLPALQQDPQAMERIGLKVEQNADGTVRIWQPPGDRNALGRIRFNFPNKFLVYQHDTPDKYLFAKDVRAFSHGCMRVENPLKYGEVLLGLALPIFIAAGLPLLGYAGAAFGWLVQRGVQALIEKRARASDDPRTVAGLLTGSMIARGWIVAGSIFVVGLSEREAGLSAAILSITLFTFYFTGQLIGRPFETERK